MEPSPSWLLGFWLLASGSLLPASGGWLLGTDSDSTIQGSDDSRIGRFKDPRIQGLAIHDE
jgi:hypothetical protein